MTMKPPADSPIESQAPAKASAGPLAAATISTGTVFTALLEALNRSSISAEHERELALLQACIDERITQRLHKERRKRRRRQLRFALLTLLIVLCLLGAFIAGMLVGEGRAGGFTGSVGRGAKPRSETL